MKAVWKTMRRRKIQNIVQKSARVDTATRNKINVAIGVSI